MKLFSFLFVVFSLSIINAQEVSDLTGKVTDETNNPIPFANIYITDLNKGTSADEHGVFTLTNVPYGDWVLNVSAIGYKSSSLSIPVNVPILSDINFQLVYDNELEQVEVFGNRNDRPDKIESLTRLPLKPYEQIQSISVISGKLLEDQGALTISEATKNVPGVYTFATYGNKRESMSSRGFRGIPILDRKSTRLNSSHVRISYAVFC